MDPDWYNDKKEKILNFLDQIPRVPHNQAFYLLLAKCGTFSRLVYLMRTCPPSEIAPLLGLLDQAQERSVHTLFSPLVINSKQLLQTKIKQTLGGLGLRDASTHHCAALMACILQVYPLVKLILPMFYPNENDIVPSLESYFSTAQALYNSRVPAAKQVHAPPLSLAPAKHTQQKLSKHIDQQLLANLRRSFNGDIPNLSRLSDCAVKRSGDFLNAPLGYVGTYKMKSLFFKIALLYRLGHTFAPETAPCIFNSTHAHPQHAEVLNRHMLICKVKGGPIKRHDQLRDYLGGIAMNAHVSVTYEPRDLVNRRLHGNLRPGDVVLREFRDGVDTVVDVTYSDPLNPQIRTGNASKGGHSALLRDEKKIAKYKEKVKPREFIPFSISLYGAPGPRAVGLIDQLAYRIAQMREVPKDQVADMLWVGISTVSFNSFAEMIHKRSPHMLTVTPFDVLPPVGD